MAGFLFHDIIFGPVRSRRLGISLGINLLPAGIKYCTYNCLYCECGWTNSELPKKGTLPSRKEIRNFLELKLEELRESEIYPDALTFAGNGEPTIHPQFAGIVEDTIDLRDHFFPDADVVVLSNATQLNKPEIFNALGMVDQNILKLDAGTEEVFQKINLPKINITLSEIVNNLKKFEGDLIIQTLFLKGENNGQAIDNTNEEEIKEWLGHIKTINPHHVMIYSIDRDTPAENLERIPLSELEEIAAKVNELGVKTQVYG